jgi:ElaB/YqjD/DUF883 family membrane-anchored ribosome-binding protein
MFFRIIFVMILFCATGGASVNVFAQQKSTAPQQQAPSVPGRDASNNRREMEYAPGDPMLETMAKMRIRAEVKEYEELLTRGEDVVKISEELKNFFQQNGTLAERAAEKLSQLEKSLKKIRKSFGGDDNDENETGAASLAEAVAKLAETGAALGEELKKTNRYTISADVIDRANEMLELIVYIRNSAR